jgi:hypothetical protein
MSDPNRPADDGSIDDERGRWRSGTLGGDSATMRGRLTRIAPELTLGRAVTLAVVGLLVVSAAGVALAASEQEPNDSRSDAQAISTGETVTGEITQDDQDWFAFEADRGEAIILTITTESNPDSGDLSASIDGPNGENIDSESVIEPGSTAELGGIAERSGTYYVEMSNRIDGTNGYSLEVETQQTDDFEPNQNQENATPLTDGNASGEITLNEQDVFSFEAERGKAILATITTENVPGSGDLSASIDGPNGENIDSESVIEPGSTAELGGIAERSGTYYVEMSNRIDGTNGYSLEVETRQTDEFEPNEGTDDLAATPLTDGNASGEITLNEQDWFAFDARPGQNISATITTASNVDSGKLSAGIDTPTGDSVDFESVIEPGSVVELSGTTDRNGTHFLELDNRIDGTNAYSVRVTVDGEPATNTLYGPPPVGIFDSRPTDPDGDGLYENVNGDGAFDPVDVQALFANIDDSTIQTNPDQFNFNGDADDEGNARVNVVDTQKLFVEERGND